MLEDLRMSIEFIHAMEAASLDNGDLSEGILECIWGPSQVVLSITDQEELFTIKQFLACQGASQETYSAVRDNQNEFFPESPMISYEQVRNRIAKWSGIEAIMHDMCPNSCIVYTECPHPECRVSRWDTFQLKASWGKVKVPAQKFLTMPIGPQIQVLWRSPGSAAELNYRHEKTEEILETLRTNGRIDMFEDILHGCEYLEAVRRGDVGRYNTVIMFGVNGAQLYQDKQSDCWMYIWVIIDFNPNVCYNIICVLPGGVIPGPHKPKHMDSFLFPGFHHSVRDSNIYFLLGCSDVPGSIYITGLVGHSGAIHCQLYCGIKGHYYPVLLRPHHYNVPRCTHLDISVCNIKGPSEETYQTNLAYMLGSSSTMDYERQRRETGIVKPSLISRFGKRHRLPLTSTTSTWDWAVLKGKPWEEHGCDVAACWPYLPGSSDRPPWNIALKIKSGYKSKEWQGYLYALVPALLHNILPHKYWKNFCKLALGICLFHQCAISCEHLRLGQQMVEEHLVEYRIPCLGPPMLTSQWMMERMIGNLGEEIKQPSNPYQNLSQHTLQWCQVNMLKELIPGLQKEKLNFPQGAEDLGDGYRLLRPHTSYLKHFDRLISEARHRLGVRPAPEGPVKIVKWGRLCLPTGQIACSIYKEARTPLERLRRACCVKLKLDGQVELSEVNFYFQISLEVEI
ncbi:hypothetical protein K439DRAFT_1649767 [Ramaria rubella]|nr:hypothetical protein K439DRAFT_1649767 [Ramaria rubella]